MTDRNDKCEHGVPMAFLYCRECSIVWHKEGAREAQERLDHHQRCLVSLSAAQTADVTESHRELARQAMVRGYHDCGARWQAGPGRSCDCDDSRIDGCKARVEAIAAALTAAQRVEGET